jgi:multidrug transporter EmrE-like cation transporter
MICWWRRCASFDIFLVIDARHFYGEALTLPQRTGIALIILRVIYISLPAA